MTQRYTIQAVIYPGDTAHKELDTGALCAIFRQASQYIPESVLRMHFFTE